MAVTHEPPAHDITDDVIADDTVVDDDAVSLFGDGTVESLDVLAADTVEDPAADTGAAVEQVLGKAATADDRPLHARRAFETVCDTCFMIHRADGVVDGKCPDCR